MTFRPTLPLMTAAAVLLCGKPPCAVAAQPSPRHHDIGALSAAIEEVRRSPFHLQTGVAVSAFLHLPGYPPAHPHQEVRETPAPDSLPTFRAVFLPTVTVTYLADAVGFWALLCWGFGGGGGCIDNGLINLAIGTTIPIVVPAYMASTSGRVGFKPALIGSAIGAGAVAALIPAIDPDNWPVVLLPLLHAAATTFARLEFARRD